MRLLIMDGNTVANVIEVDSTAIPPEFADAPVAPEGVGVGMLWNGTDYDPPAAAPVTVERVKREAQRRILAIVPEWKQRNLTAQAVILAKKGDANWTTDEQASWDSGEALWTQIAAIRAASDVLESKDPIPQDFKEDTYWP